MGPRSIELTSGLRIDRRRWCERREAVFARREVHYWLASDPSRRIARDFDRFMACLSSHEQVRYERFHFDEDRNQFLLGRALLRETLSHYRRAIPPASWCFEFNAFGKPKIARHQCGGDLYFNLSHTAGLVALAVYAHAGVGIDVEADANRSRGASLARYVFMTSELARYETLDDDARRRFLHRLWTLKEAYVKACGKGLSIPMNSFCFELDARGVPWLQHTPTVRDNGRCWRFFDTQVGGAHRLALAWNQASASDVEVIGFEFE